MTTTSKSFPFHHHSRIILPSYTTQSRKRKSCIDHAGWSKSKSREIYVYVDVSSPDCSRKSRHKETYLTFRKCEVEILGNGSNRLEFDNSRIKSQNAFYHSVQIFCLIVRCHSLTHEAEPFLRSYQLCSYSSTSQHFMEPEGSLRCSREPSTSPYTEPYRSSPYHPILSKIHLNTPKTGRIIWCFSL
jgi:hypothetical protein